MVNVYDGVLVSVPALLLGGVAISNLPVAAAVALGVIGYAMFVIPPK